MISKKSVVEKQVKLYLSKIILTFSNCYSITFGSSALKIKKNHWKYFCVQMAIGVRQSINTLRIFRILSVFRRNINMSSNLRAKEALEELKKKNPYYEKYASKITALQQTSPEEFLNRLENVEDKNKSPKKREKER